MLVCAGDGGGVAPPARRHRQRRPAPRHDQRCPAKPASQPGRRRRWWWWTAWRRPHARLRERPGEFRRL